MTDRELMQQALEALNHVNVQDRVQIIAALRERLAQHEALDKLVAIDQELGMFEQPEQELVAHLYRDHNGQLKLSQISPQPRFAFPVYTAPQPRQWQGLTNEEFSFGIQMASNTSWMKAAKWVEAKLREKNNV